MTCTRLAATRLCSGGGDSNSGPATDESGALSADQNEALMRDAATGLKVKRNGKAHPKAGRPARSRLKVRTGMKAGAQSRLWL